MSSFGGYVEAIQCVKGSVTLKRQVPVEVEKDNTLVFLDVHVTRRDTKLNTCAYCKATYTNYYIPFQFHHHPRTIMGGFRCMWDKAIWICDSTVKTTKLQHFQDFLKSNGLPKDMLRKTLSPLPPPPDVETPRFSVISMLETSV